MQRVSAAISPMLRVVEWVFAPLAPGIDLFLGSVAAAWLGMMLGKPEMFEQGNFVGMQWAPDRFWVAFVLAVAVMHGVGLLCPAWIKARIAACLASSWYWILIALSLSRPGLTTGTWTYGIIGLAALVSAIYVSGRLPRTA